MIRNQNTRMIGFRTLRSLRNSLRSLREIIPRKLTTSKAVKNYYNGATNTL